MSKNLDFNADSMQHIRCGNCDEPMTIFFPADEHNAVLCGGCGAPTRVELTDGGFFTLTLPVDDKLREDMGLLIEVSRGLN